MTTTDATTYVVFQDGTAHTAMLALEDPAQIEDDGVHAPDATGS